MKRLITVPFALLCAFLLAACAGSAPVRQSPVEIDSAYVSSIEGHASRAGVDVVWINPPKKKVRAETSDSRR